MFRYFLSVPARQEFLNEKRTIRNTIRLLVLAGGSGASRGWVSLATQRRDMNIFDTHYKAFCY